jgi:hypothetical protein
VRDRRLVYDMDVGGEHAVVTSGTRQPAGRCRLGVAVRNTSVARAITLLRDAARLPQLHPLERP